MGLESVYKIKEQLSLIYTPKRIRTGATFVEKLEFLLKGDLDFHNQNSLYSLHNFHSFPAKFPPQLPKAFIKELTNVGDTVLDPMVGSGTTVLEAFLAKRKSYGFDIDPLAIKLSTIKTRHFDQNILLKYYQTILNNAEIGLKDIEGLNAFFQSKFDLKTREFIGYWFGKETRNELLALLKEINRIDDPNIKDYFEIVFSSIIITKTGGVSLALDLAHTRPHKAKVILNKDNQIIKGADYLNSKRVKYITKTTRSPIDEFKKRFYQNLTDFHKDDNVQYTPKIHFGNAQELSLPDNSIDLIVTSPPYASNAIDYMRAHKFSLVWLGYDVEGLTNKRKEYIGGEFVTQFQFEKLPEYSKQKIEIISNTDKKRGLVLHRYYSEMKRAISEMYRVLKPGKAAIVVVGTSMMKGIDTETQICLAEIGMEQGFKVPHIGVRKLDRNKRMMPAGSQTDLSSQIQQRMHEEYVIGFYKPE